MALIFFRSVPTNLHLFFPGFVQRQTHAGREEEFCIEERQEKRRKERKHKKKKGKKKPRESVMKRRSDNAARCSLPFFFISFLCTGLSLPVRLLLLVIFEVVLFEYFGYFCVQTEGHDDDTNRQKDHR